MLGRAVNSVLKHNLPAYPWGNALPVLRNADFKICNLECVISDRGQPWPDKAFNFRSDPKNVKVLKTANFSPVSVANNHTLDFGVEALEQSLNILKRNRVNFAGAGIDAVEELVSGKQTHDFPLTFERGKQLGLNISDNVPKVIDQLMALYTQPPLEKRSVEYIPTPYIPTVPKRSE